MRICDIPHGEWLHLSKDDRRIITCQLSLFDGTPGTCRWCARPLSRNKDGSVSKVRRWCGQLCALAYSSNHAWGRAKQAVRQRDGETCQSCGSNSDQIDIQVHHIVPRRGRRSHRSCINHIDNLLCLCSQCHVWVTRHQQAARLRGGSDVFGWTELARLVSQS